MSDQRPGGPGDPNAAEADEASDPGQPASVLGQLWDIVRYAPIAIVLDGPALLPKLAEQGKVHMGNARYLGARAMREAEPQIRRLLEEAGTQTAEILKRLGVVADDEPAAEAPPPRRRAGEARPVAVTAAPGASRNGQTADADSGPAVAELAIPDYDSLPAAHVLNRLPALTPDELEAVRRYEAGHRGRKTILNKVAQLQTP